MTIKSILASAGLALLVSVPASAAPVKLEFSFDGVSGTLFGLDDATGTSTASSGFIDGILGDYSFSIPPTAVVDNSFTFLGGSLVLGAFTLGQNVFSETGDSIATGFRVFLTTATTASSEGYLGEVPSDRSFFTEDFGPAEFRIVPADTTPVPLPAGAVLLLSGVAGLTALRRRKKHAG